MAQTKILIDTNTYLRLAQSIHPLLKNPFGKNEYCLYILPDLYQEYKKSPRLKTSFAWVENEDYVINRNWEHPKSKKLKYKEHMNLFLRSHMLLTQQYQELILCVWLMDTF